MHFGWVVVAGVLLSQFFATGFYTYGFGLLVLPMQESLGASRAEIMYGFTGATFVGLFWAPLAGVLVDKWSVRGLMLLGAVVFAAALFAMAHTTAVMQYVIIFSLGISVAMRLLGTLTGSAVVSRWFTENRGKALGVAAVGTSLGGLFIPLLIEYWLAAGGWRYALTSFAYLVMFLLLPVLLFCIRDYPQSRGIEKTIDSIDKEKTDKSENQASSRSTDADTHSEWSGRDIYRNPAFWYVGICLGLLFMCQSAVLTNLPAYAADLGVSDANAARLIMVIAATGMMGKLAFGHFADRLSLKWGLATAVVLAFCGVLILAFEPLYFLMLIAAVCFGLATGGMLPVWGALIASLFGIASYGRVMGLMTPMISILVMPGPLLAGMLYDRSGSYVSSFICFAVVLVIAFLVLMPLRIPAQARQ